jgi:stearoyl-CoA desaturase (Delta-9 desaturase)
MSQALFAGLVDLPWWGYIVAALALTHITIVAVTVFLHRHQAHHALALHPWASHFFRLWLWLTTGMKTREWVAVHRKHHAKCDTPQDPHSPQYFGINRVLWGGVFLYVRETRHPETMERYGHGTPDDWLERKLYASHSYLGLVLMGAIDIAVFGAVPGLLILVTQIVWIPFWAAGVINGICHYWGYRNWSTPDWSTNMSPWGLLIGGEELHNNHHAFPTSARFAIKRYEFDLGWLYVRALQGLGLATVKHVAPVPHFTAPKPVVDQQTLEAVIANRYDVLAKFGASLKRAYLDERATRGQAERARELGRLLKYDEKLLRAAESRRLAETVAGSRALGTMVSMRRDLAALWQRSAASREELVRRLQDWCQRAEASGIRPLVEFSQRLRSYA